MTEPTGKLDDLRREIDEIDAKLHDLIMRRAAIVEQVAAAKGQQADSGMRPGREAEILRRLAVRHEGPFPRGSVMRIWREIIASLTAMQGPYNIAVFADEDHGLWDLSRDHFGSHTSISLDASRRSIVSKVANGAATHGILPWPADEDDRPWWSGLWSSDAPRIVVRLPFSDPGNVRGEDVQALVIARVAPEKTGDDRSLLLMEIGEEQRRARFAEMLAQSGMEGSLVCAATDGSRQCLLEVGGFVEDGDPRLAKLMAHDNVERVRVVGAYPVPLPAP